MSDNMYDDLKSQFESFLDPQNAAYAAEDVFEGDRILNENPAPMPSEQLKARIKSRVRLTLMRTRRVSSRRFVYQLAAAAAAIIIVFGISIQMVDNKPGHIRPIAQISAAVWDGTNITSDDAELSRLSAGIEQVEQELSGTQLTLNIADSADAADELEMELINIDSDFWKG